MNIKKLTKAGILGAILTITPNIFSEETVKELPKEILNIDFKYKPKKSAINFLNKKGDIKLKREDGVEKISIKGDPKGRAQVSLFMTVRQVDDAKTHFKFSFDIKKDDKKANIYASGAFLYNRGNRLLQRIVSTNNKIEKINEDLEKYTFIFDSNTEDWDGYFVQFRILLFVDKGNAEKIYNFEINNIVAEQY